MMERAKQLIKDCDGVTLSIDHWTPTSAGGISHLGFVFTFQGKKGLEELAVALVPCGHGAQAIHDKVLEVLHSWNVPLSKVRALASDNAPSVVAAIRSLRVHFEGIGLPPPVHIRCVAHAVQLAANAIIEDPFFVGAMQQLQATVTWWRAYGKYIHSHPGMHVDDSVPMENRENPEFQPKLPTKPPATSQTRWNSTYYQLAWICDVRFRPYLKAACDPNELSIIWNGPSGSRGADGKVLKSYHPPALDWDESGTMHHLECLLTLLEPLAELTIIVQSGTVPVLAAAWRFLVSWLNSWNMLPSVTPQTLQRRKAPTPKVSIDETSSQPAQPNRTSRRGRALRISSVLSDRDILLDQGTGVIGGLLNDWSEPEEENPAIRLHGVPTPPTSGAVAKLAEWKEQVWSGALAIHEHLGDFIRLSDDELALAVYCHPGTFDAVLAGGVESNGDDLVVLPRQWQNHINQRRDVAKKILTECMNTHAVVHNIPGPVRASHALGLFEQIGSGGQPVSLKDLSSWWTGFEEIQHGALAAQYSAQEITVLATRARQALSVVPASAAAERFFSVCGLVDAPRRSRLASRSLGILSILKFNLHHF
jgi:hypothetical protein